jgi:hypothetical protein
MALFYPDRIAYARDGKGLHGLPIPHYSKHLREAGVASLTFPARVHIQKPHTPIPLDKPEPFSPIPLSGGDRDGVKAGLLCRRDRIGERPATPRFTALGRLSVKV